MHTEQQVLQLGTLQFLSKRMQNVNTYPSMRIRKAQVEGLNATLIFNPSIFFFFFFIEFEN